MAVCVQGIQAGLRSLVLPFWGINVARFSSLGIKHKCERSRSFYVHVMFWDQCYKIYFLRQTKIWSTLRQPKTA